MEKAIQKGAMLVVDTLFKFAGIRGDGENASGEAVEAMGPLQLATSAGLSVAVIRHERKSGGNVGDSARVSSAFGGKPTLSSKFGGRRVMEIRTCAIYRPYPDSTECPPTFTSN